LRICFIIIFVLSLFNCREARYDDTYDWKTIKVTASAYNSTRQQTDKNPHITAFGDSLKPGLSYVAVSNDLFRKGLKHNVPIKIEGIDSIYFVKDRMHSRWKNRIDIYMGVDITAAKEWGRKKVIISYGVPKKVDD
jgi:3D (Asp-Asp-Asp) domain-containing protein